MSTMPLKDQLWRDTESGRLVRISESDYDDDRIMPKRVVEYTVVDDPSGPSTGWAEIKHWMSRFEYVGEAE